VAKEPGLSPEQAKESLNTFSNALQSQANQEVYAAGIDNVRGFYARMSPDVRRDVIKGYAYGDKGLFNKAIALHQAGKI